MLIQAASSAHAIVATEAANPNWYQIGTIVALLLTAATGFLAYRANERTQAKRRANDEQGELAKLRHAESEGWQTLVETLTKRYGESQTEIVTLAERLKEAHEGAVELQERWRTLQIGSTQRVAELEAEVESVQELANTRQRAYRYKIAHLQTEIKALKAEVADLQAEINDA